MKGRWAINTIWELDDPNGGKVTSFKELAHLGVSHFSNLSRDP